MQPEFIKLESELAELWWRVPLTLIFFILFWAPIIHVSEIEYEQLKRCKREDSQSNPMVFGPASLNWLRGCALIACARFVWIYLASLNTTRNYEISKVEACCWLVYIGIVVPLWIFEEKEKLLCMSSTSSSNTRNTLPKRSSLL